MRKRAKKLLALLALLTAVTVTVTGVNVPAAQAAKPKVSASKTTLYYNGTGAEKKATVTVKNVKGKKVTYSISKASKKIVKLGKVSGNKTKKFTVTAKKKGTAKDSMQNDYGFIVWEVPKNWKTLDIAYSGFEHVNQNHIEMTFSKKDLQDPPQYESVTPK